MSFTQECAHTTASTKCKTAGTGGTGAAQQGGQGKFGQQWQPKHSLILQKASVQQAILTKVN
jgi:hypothetical protein